jgi:hypothetical protein
MPVSLVPYAPSLPNVRRLVVRSAGRPDASFDATARRQALTEVAERVADGLEASLLAEVEPTRPSGADLLGEILAAPLAARADGAADAVVDHLAALRGREPVTMTTAAARALAPEVDREAAARVARDAETLRSVGLAPPPTMYADGTTLWEVGKAAARAERREHDALPDAVPAMERLEAEVKAEDRRDVIVSLAALRLTSGLELCREGGPLAKANGRPELPRVAVEEAALRRLQADLRAAIKADGDLGIATLAAMPQASLREQAARTWNHCAAALNDAEKRTGDRKTVALRTRKVEVPGEGGAHDLLGAATTAAGAPRREQVYAVVSEGYGECDADKIARACRELVEGQAGRIKADVIYDRAAGKVKIDLVTRTSVLDGEQCVGDLSRAGLRVRSDDTGKGSLNVWAFVERIRCRNRTLVAAEGAHTVIRHLGDPQRLLLRLQEALAASSGALLTFAAQWAEAAGDKITARLEAEKREQRAQLAELVEDLTRRDHLRATLADLGLSPSGQAVLDGTYRSLLREHELAPAKAVEEQVAALRAAHWSPENAGAARDRSGGLSRAAVANGVTLWAQGQPLGVAHAAEALAGRIVSGDAALSWLAPPQK